MLNFGKVRRLTESVLRMGTEYVYTTEAVLTNNHTPPRFSHQNLLPPK